MTRVNRLGIGPNIRRQALYVAIALVTLLGGYGAGLMFKAHRQGSVQLATPTSRKSPADSQRNTEESVLSKQPRSRVTGNAPNSTVYPDSVPLETEIPVRAYEEALPSEVYEYGMKENVPGNPPNLESGETLPPPESVAEPDDSTSLPPWRRYAVASPERDGMPMVVVVIDDLGMDRKRTARAIGLQGPLTLSFLAYAEDLKKQTAAARAAGHELLMHVGMEPVGQSVDPGPNVLLTGLDSEEIRHLLEWDLGRSEGYVGINNHMGSKFTADPSAMTVVMEMLKRRGLLFLDSRTTGRSVGAKLARELGVPVAERNIFLDNVNETAAVDARLGELERLARRRGYAVAIGHPRDATLEALERWLPSLGDRGLVLVPLSAVVSTDQDKHQLSAHYPTTQGTMIDSLTGVLPALPTLPGDADPAEDVNKGKM
jgi:uncharacterized protein